MDNYPDDEYIDDDTELELDDDFDPNELDDDFVWHPALRDGFSVEFARQGLPMGRCAYGYIVGDN